MGIKEDEFIYVLIRVPKSASTSLMNMFSNAYPNSQGCSIPTHPRLKESDSLLEKLRATKNYKLSLFKNYRCFSEKCVWEKVESSLKPEDIVSGHFTIDDIKITLDEAIYHYTLGAAYSTFEEYLKGSLEIGKVADFIVLEKNIYEIDPEIIKDVQIQQTFFNGKLVYDKNSN